MTTPDRTNEEQLYNYFQDPTSEKVSREPANIAAKQLQACALHRLANAAERIAAALEFANGWDSPNEGQ